MDIHVGQSYSFLVTMDQNASSDYYIVASPRFVNSSSWARATGVAILHYSTSQGPAVGPLPVAPDDFDTYFSMNQARSIRLYPFFFFFSFLSFFQFIINISKKKKKLIFQ